MSEVQALETKTEIDIVKDEVIDDENSTETQETDEAIEIEVEEAGKPPARRLSGFEKRLRKNREQVTEAEARVKALEEENKLLRLAQQHEKDTTLTEPNEKDFELGADDPKYRAAIRHYDKELARKEAREETQALLEQSQQNIAHANQVQQIDSSITAHYERADALKVKNYDELENSATDILGEDFVKTLIASTDDSHRILASMGAAPGKTAQIAALIKTNPIKAFAEAVRFEINSALNPPSLKTAPDPEVQVDPGAGVVSTEAGLEGVKFE